MRTKRRAWFLAILWSAACETGGAASPSFGGATDDAGDDDTSSASSSAAASSSHADTGADTTGGGVPKLDVGTGETGGGSSLCSVGDDDLDAAVCRTQGPADAFTPSVQWAWTGEGGDDQVVATPLVLNLTDDNADGNIDLCDTPDIVVLAYDDCDAGECLGVASRVYVLDGATGAVHFQAGVEAQSGNGATPAAGDIDGDGLPEIVVPTATGIAALEHDGTLKWQAAGAGRAAIGIADLDNDGSPEIYSGLAIWNAAGELESLLSATEHSIATTAADLDGDGDLELVAPRAAYHHDGALHYHASEVGTVSFADGVQIANVDDDAAPEVVVTGNGISILEHDGTPKLVAFPNDDHKWGRPAAIHDMNGDGAADLAAGTGFQYNVLTLSPLALTWSALVVDQSAAASGTAFDFLGDGVAEAMYADETSLFIFDGDGVPVLQVERTSWTDIELPVVADVDNDGSAEIVVVSNKGYTNGDAPAVQVIGDAENRWIQARRIWNQHAYHVTNVREDGTIPQYEQPSWTELNTFRTQSQIEGGVVCIPPAG